MAEKTILVVDDEKNIRLTLTRALEDLGRPVAAAVNGEDALHQVEATDVGVMLLDLKMPGMDGMEVLRRIADLHPDIRVIIITAHGTVPNAVEALKLGAVDFLQKPFSPDEVRDLVRGVLDRETVTPTTTGGSYDDELALAKHAVNERQLKVAIDHARQAIAINASRAEAFNLLGALLEITGKRLDALEHYRVALELDPTNKAAAANLERVTHRQWDTSKHGPPELG